MRVPRHFFPAGFILLAGLSTPVTGADEAFAGIRLGKQLFTDSHFAQNPPAAPVSCASCHVIALGSGDFFGRNAVPVRNDGQRQTPRHAQALADALEVSPGGWGLLHWDGEFTTVENLVAGTFTGRNFGWLPDEKAQATRHFAQVIRGDPKIAALFLETSTDPAAANDEQILESGAKAVGAYLRTLRFSRASSGEYNGSPYDAFLRANNLPAAPAPGEAPMRYARRLHEAVAGLKAPRLVDDPGHKVSPSGQPFRFGELELKGMRIFFRGALGYGQNSSAGNCVECHVPPQFADGAFHNTGAAQDGYDAVHGAGAFVRLAIPSLVERAREPERWLPASPQRLKGTGVFRSPVSIANPALADLGLWNVYGNPDLPGPQPAIERKLNAGNRLTPDEVLVLTTGRFKTPTVRDLGHSAPYLHDGRLQSVEDVLNFYRRMSDLAREGKLRNAPLEYHSMRLQPGDIAPLAAFLRALDETAGSPAPP